MISRPPPVAPAVAPTAALDPEHPKLRPLIDAAADLFTERGYRGASMSAIARHAGVSKSLLHYHFATKEALFLEVQRRFFAEILDQVKGVTAGRGISDLTAAFAEVLASIESNPKRFVMLVEFRDVAAASLEAAERLRIFRAEVDALIVTGLVNALGPLVGSLVIPPERAARLLMMMFSGLALEVALIAPDDAPGRAALRQTVEDARDLLIAALLPKPNLK